MHDSSHAAYTKDHKMWGLVGRFTLDWFAGANLSSWLNQHVVGHHIYTNVAGKHLVNSFHEFLINEKLIFFAGVDPDLPVNFDSDMRRIVDRQVKTLWISQLLGHLVVLYEKSSLTKIIFFCREFLFSCKNSKCPRSWQIREAMSKYVFFSDFNE